MDFLKSRRCVCYIKCAYSFVLQKAKGIGVAVCKWAKITWAG